MKMTHCYLFLIVILIFCSFTNVIKVNAVNTGFETNELSIDEKNMFIANIKISLIDKEPVKKAIICFDVNSNQLIAIGQNALDRKTICIYSNEGVFQYGYTFNCSGSFGVEWDEENLNIFFIRSSVIVSVSPSGQVIDVFKVQDTIENNSYINHFILSTKRTIGDIDYALRNEFGLLNFFIPSYSIISAKNSTNGETIIYDVSSDQLLNLIGVISIVLLFIFVVLAFLIWSIVKTRQSG